MFVNLSCHSLGHWACYWLLFGTSNSMALRLWCC